MADSSRIQFRQLTSVRANWSEQGEGADDKLSLRLALDNGAVEHVARPTAQDTKVFLKLLNGTEIIYHGIERQVAIYGEVELG